MTRRTFGAARKLPSGRWQARYRAPDGDRVTAPHTFATKTDALRWLASIETDLTRGDWHDARLGAVSFKVVSDEWMVTKRPRLRASTIDAYEYMLRVHIVPAFGETPVGCRLPVRWDHPVARCMGPRCAHVDRLAVMFSAAGLRVKRGVADGSVSGVRSVS